jgi:hypothetical protein
MTLDAYLTNDFSTYAGIVSGVFVIAVALKIGSTAALLLDRRSPHLSQRWNEIGW